MSDDVGRRPISETVNPEASASLSLSFMEECYQTCCFGYAEPAYIVMSESRREELRGLIADTRFVREMHPEWLEYNGPLGYNNSVVIGLPDCTDDYVWYVNVEYPQKAELNQRFAVQVVGRQTTEGPKG